MDEVPKEHYGVYRLITAGEKMDVLSWPGITSRSIFSAEGEMKGDSGRVPCDNCHTPLS